MTRSPLGTKTKSRFSLWKLIWKITYLQNVSDSIAYKRSTNLEIYSTWLSKNKGLTSKFLSLDESEDLDMSWLFGDCLMQLLRLLEMITCVHNEIGVKTEKVNGGMKCNVRTLL